MKIELSHEQFWNFRLGFYKSLHTKLILWHWLVQNSTSENVQLAKHKLYNDLDFRFGWFFCSKPFKRCLWHLQKYPNVTAKSAKLYSLYVSSVDKYLPVLRWLGCQPLFHVPHSHLLLQSKYLCTTCVSATLCVPDPFPLGGWVGSAPGGVKFLM